MGWFLQEELPLPRFPFRRFAVHTIVSRIGSAMLMLALACFITACRSRSGSTRLIAQRVMPTWQDVPLKHAAPIRTPRLVLSDGSSVGSFATYGIARPEEPVALPPPRRVERRMVTPDEMVEQPLKTFEIPFAWQSKARSLVVQTAPDGRELRAVYAEDVLAGVDLFESVSGVHPFARATRETTPMFGVLAGVVAGAGSGVVEYDDTGQPVRVELYSSR